MWNDPKATAEMEALLRRAESEGAMLYTAYHDLWFTPKELREAQADGRFRWGAVNWAIRPASDFLDKTARKLKDAEREHMTAVMRVERMKGGA